MLESQRLMLRLSELRERINAAPEDMDTSELEKLTTEHRESEVRYRAALVKEAPDDPQDQPPDRQELRQRVEFREYLNEAATGQPATGAAAELRQEVLKEFAAPGKVPWETLLSLEPEQRADAATDLSSTTVGRTQQPVIPRVFARSATAYLGVTMPTVGVGESNYPVLTGGVAPTQVAAGAAKDAEAATFTVETLAPRRLSARYLLRLEDLNRFGGLEDSLRRDLRDALADAMDNLVLNSNGTAPNPTGFFSELTAPDDPSALATFADFMTATVGGVDGKYAGSLSDMRMLVGPASYKKAASLFHGNGDVDAASYLMARSGGIRVSGNVPDPASTIQGALTYATGGAGSAVAPVWEGLSLIRDPYSAAESGEISITAVALWNFKILREAPYSYQKFKVAS